MYYFSVSLWFGQFLSFMTNEFKDLKKCLKNHTHTYNFTFLQAYNTKAMFHTVWMSNNIKYNCSYKYAIKWQQNEMLNSFITKHSLNWTSNGTACYKKNRNWILKICPSHKPNEPCVKHPCFWLSFSFDTK